MQFKFRTVNHLSENGVPPLKKIKRRTPFPRAFAVPPIGFILMLAGVIIITTAELSTAQNVISLLVLALCMIWVILLPILVYVFAGDRASEALETMNQWIVKQQRWIVFVLLSLFGLILLTAGISELGIFQG
jgi:Mn2+/Fe2+ NRAMP family transporter